MIERLRVGLLFGGASVEHEVSVVSARGVALALDPDRFETVPLGIGRNGRWLPPAESAQVLGSGAKRVEAGEGEGERLVVDPGFGGLLRVGPGTEAQRLPVDVVFSVVHGWGGEDGRIQGLLELANIAYVGSAVLGSALAMDKAMAKQVLSANGVPQGRYRSFRAHEITPG